MFTRRCEVSEIRVVVCLGCRGKGIRGDIQCERIEFRMGISVIRIWKVG